ncbi:MAG: hypothetical protein D6806_13035 [Deltaproteobacteria bacterium]|nr:MAG: hypothetical protein D6806_13035 [Deltaproteobacteria bacterium]
MDRADGASSPAPHEGRGEVKGTQSSEKTVFKVFRWTVYTLFLGGMAFVAACLVVGIVSHLNWRYTDVEASQGMNADGSELDQLQLGNCLEWLEQLKAELDRNIHNALKGAGDRRELLRRWRGWSFRWRRRFEKVGYTCKLTGYTYPEKSLLAKLAGIYRLQDVLERNLDRMVRAFIIENARSLSELRELLDRARKELQLPPT